MLHTKSGFRWQRGFLLDVQAANRVLGCCSQRRVRNNGRLLPRNKRSFHSQRSISSVTSMTIRGAQTRNGDPANTLESSTESAQQKLRSQVPHTTSVIVLTNKNAPPATVVQSLLQKRLPSGVHLLGVGDDLDALRHVTDEQWASVDVVLKWGGNTPIGQVNEITCCKSFVGLDHSH